MRGARLRDQLSLPSAAEQQFAGGSVRENAAEEGAARTNRTATQHDRLESADSFQGASADAEPLVGLSGQVSFPSSVAAASHNPFAVVDIRREKEILDTHWVLTAGSYSGDKPDTCSSDVL